MKKKKIELSKEFSEFIEHESVRSSLELYELKILRWLRITL